MSDFARQVMDSVAGAFNGHEAEAAEPEQKSGACPHCDKHPDEPVDPNSNMGKFFKGTRGAFGNE